MPRMYDDYITDDLFDPEMVFKHEVYEKPYSTGINSLAHLHSSNIKVKTFNDFFNDFKEAALSVKEEEKPIQDAPPPSRKMNL